MGKDTFAVLLLLGRPACGKSQIIESLKRVPFDVRAGRFHIANLGVLDDFPTVWSWLEEDDILSERLGQPRLHTHASGAFRHDYMRDVLMIERLHLDYHKRVRADTHDRDPMTAVLEFSRASVCGGYAQAFSHLADNLLQHSAAICVQVTFDESLCRNDARFVPDRLGGTLEYSLPDEILRRYYSDDGWATLTAADPDYLTVGDIQDPYVALENEQCQDAYGPDALTDRLEACLAWLWERTGDADPWSIVPESS